MQKKGIVITLLGIMLFIHACKKSDTTTEVTVAGPNTVVYGLSPNNELIKFNGSTPQTFTSKTTITGLAAGEALLSIDFRPATGEMYGLGNAGKLYIINTATAAARAVNATVFSPAVTGLYASIDFNPTVDRIRLVTNTGQNLRLNPETGAVAATDGSINGGASPVISGIAYTNSKAGASTTVLYDIDVTSGKLYRQDPPNNGTLVEVGSLGISFTGQAAFDISVDNSAALLATRSGPVNTLYSVDLNTGKASKIASLPEQVIDLAIPTEPVAYGVDNSNNLLIFNPDNPAPVSKTIAGLQAGENIYGIDFRPVNGQLYALGSSSRLYTINLATGQATAVSPVPFTPLLAGTDFGFDFNPTVDRIRVVSNTGQNLRLNPNDGAVAATDLALNPGTPSITAAAYINNYAGATITSLFVIDHSTDKLYIQNPPNNGTLVEVGSLGIDIGNSSGFDIGSMSQKPYLVATVGGTTKIYTVNTTTGAVTAGTTLPAPVKAFSIGLGF